jgi:hypothetical protein
MRTPEDWAAEIGKATGTGRDHQSDLNVIVRAIQADALRHAAAFVKSNLGLSWSICGMENSLLSEAIRLSPNSEVSSGAKTP